MKPGEGLTECAEAACPWWAAGDDALGLALEHTSSTGHPTTAWQAT